MGQQTTIVLGKGKTLPSRTNFKTMNTQIPEFKEFGKISRFSREVVITEKIDGTNAQILIADDGAPFVHHQRGELPFLCGSRTRWIYPGDDNFGFAAWAYANAKDLLGLGPGSHYGEWWGNGIQRKYNLKEKRFSLFNVGRWVEQGQPASEKQSTAPACCHVVPVINIGNADNLNAMVKDALETLIHKGSIAAPGFHNPEGIVIFHSASGALFKKTIDKDNVPKSLA